MNETLRPNPIGFEDLPAELSSHAKRCISLAIRDERIGSPDELIQLGDNDLRLRVRGRGQAHGIGTKTLENVRSVYPRIKERH